MARLIRYKGNRIPLQEAVRRSGVPATALRQRLYRGLTGEKLFRRANLLDGSRLGSGRLTIGDETYTVDDLARRGGVSVEVMSRRIRENIGTLPEDELRGCRTILMEIEHQRNRLNKLESSDSLQRESKKVKRKPVKRRR
jgi:hypothetical protein